METIKDFLKNINYRLSSPFLFSFLISWLMCNWQIAVILLFYNDSQIKATGNTHYIPLINSYLNLTYSFIIPLIGAIGYTFVFPYINKFIKVYQTKVEIATEKDELKVRKGTSIPIEKYFSLLSSVNEKQDLLERIIASESITRGELEDIRNEKSQLEVQLVEQQIELTKQKTDNVTLHNFQNDFKLLDNLESIFKGAWICEFNVTKGGDLLDPHSDFESFYIKNDEYIANGSLRFSIKHIIKIESQALISFHKKKLDEQDSINVVTAIQVFNNLWVGYEKLSGGDVAFVRFYPKNSQPLYYPIFFHQKAFEDNIIFDNFKNYYFKQWRKRNK
ncbi:MAG: hypothetical protein RLZZ367_858 [Bacteroidota bacterium]|jgi:hypothetical protein